MERMNRDEYLKPKLNKEAIQPQLTSTFDKKKQAILTKSGRASSESRQRSFV